MQKYLLILCVSGLTILSAFSQNKFSESDKFAQTILENDLKSHLFFLADDVLEGRETGTAGQRVAAQYIASRFMQMDLKPGNGKSYFQEFNVANINLEKTSLKINKQSFDYRKDYFCTELSDVPESLSNIWAFAGYGLETPDYNNLATINPSGKNILILGAQPSQKTENMRALFGMWMGIIENLKKQGATSVWMIIPDSVYNRFNVYGKPNDVTLIQEEAGSPPAFFVNEKMGNAWLAAVSKKHTVKSLSASLDASQSVPFLDFSKVNFLYEVQKNVQKTSASNVLGYLEGTDKKDELVVITAHYDHLGVQNGVVYNGADDDGSGTVTVLELAEAFSKATKEGKRPRRSILFMTVSGEEKGLWGSDFYTAHPVYPLEKTVANLNIDMIGRVDKSYAGKKDSANYVYIIGANKLSTELDSINKAVNKNTGNIVLDEKYNDENDPERFYYRSDHYNFAKNGIPVIFYFTGVHKDYHKPTDDIDKINFTKMVKIGKLVFGTAWELANNERRIVVDVKQE